MHVHTFMWDDPSWYYLYKFKLIWGIVELLLNGFVPFYLGDFCKYKPLLLEAQQRLAVILPGYYCKSVQKPMTQEERWKLGKKNTQEMWRLLTVEGESWQLVNVYTMCSWKQANKKHGVGRINAMCLPAPPATFRLWLLVSWWLAASQGNLCSRRSWSRDPVQYTRQQFLLKHWER